MIVLELLQYGKADRDGVMQERWRPEGYRKVVGGFLLCCLDAEEDTDETLCSVQDGRISFPKKVWLRGWLQSPSRKSAVEVICTTSRIWNPSHLSDRNSKAIRHGTCGSLMLRCLTRVCDCF